MKLYLTATQVSESEWVLVLPAATETGDDPFPTAEDALNAASWFLTDEGLYHQVIGNEVYLM